MVQMIRLGVTLGLVFLFGCRGEPPAPPPPPEVGVVVAQSQSVTNVQEVPGRVQAVRTAQVRARVDGIVQDRAYEEGSDVKAEQVLFRIDPRETRANVSAVQAALSRAEATAANAAQDVERYKGLVEDQAISKQEYDAAVARLRTAQADVEQTRAQLESARLALSYTTVTAPIAGQAGRAQVTEGALVSAANATLLTTIQQLDPVYVNFSQSGATLLSIRRDVTTGKLTIPTLGRVNVTLILEDGGIYPHQGHLDFLDLSIDEATGTVAIRAEVPNPDHELLPGQFVRARLDIGVRADTVLLPQRAVQLSPSGASVFVVDEQDTVAVRPIKTGPLSGNNWVVLEGLQSGERVVVDGVQKIRPGAKVRPVPMAPQQGTSPTKAAER